MKSLSPSAGRLVSQAHVVNVYQQHAARVALHSRIVAVAERADLSFLASDSRALADSVAHDIADDNSRITNLEKTITPLEEACAAEAQARAEYAAVFNAHVLGSTKRDVALRLRDDAEAARQTLEIRFREMDVAADATRQWTRGASNVGAITPTISFDEATGPKGVSTPITKTVSIAQYLALDTIHRKHRKDLVYATLPAGFTKAVGEMPEGAWRWLGLAAVKVLSDEDFWHFEPLFESGRQKRANECKPLFLEALKNLKTTRVAYLRNKVTRAAADLDAAKAASMAGAA